MLKKSNQVKKSNSMIKREHMIDVQQRLDNISQELSDLTEMFLGSNKRMMDQIEEIQRMM